jgi:subtilase family serine protease
VLKGHVPAAVAGLTPVDRLAATQRLHLAINLPMRNREALNALLQQLYDPASPSFHHFLTSEQFTAAFGPTKDDYQAVINFARANGLAVTATRANRALVEVDGSVADIEKAFHVNLRVYPHPTERRNFYAPDVEPSLDLDVPVLAIAGLTDYMIPHPASVHVRLIENRSSLTPEAGSDGGMYIGQDFRGAYAQGVTNTGTGQSVGLVEFDSYYSGDITSYLNTPQAGLANSSVMLTNVVLGGLSGPPGSGNIEVALDIEMAISMAPGLSAVYVYEATNNGSEADAILSRMASDNLSRQLSCSWSGFMDAGVQQAFLEFAAQGQSFFQASGDSGEYSQRRNPVEPPADSTNVTSVGGTTLSTTGPQGNWVSETTWSWFTQPENGLSNNATSGGISPTYSIPSWQTGISMTANQGSTSFRNLPDVSMVADDIFVIANNGSDYFAGGTSAAAPLWAGLTALINQQLAAHAQPPEGFFNPALYAIAKGPNYSSCFHDVTVGNNTNLFSSRQFFATTGYDLCTGWGTPIGAALINLLSPEPLQITAPTDLVVSGSYGGPFNVTNQNFTLTNVASASFNWSLAVSSPWLSASSSGGTLVSGGAAAIISVAPNSLANSLTVGVYANTIYFTNINDGVVQSFQYTLTVSPVAPILSWTSPASIVYGTALGAGQLDATANVPGGFAYSPANGDVLDAGTNALSVTFTPSDTLDYTSAGSMVSLIISPAPLTVTAASTNRPFGQANPAFMGTITGLTNGDNITAAYSCSATTNGPTGTYSITPSLLDPNNRLTNYAVTVVDGTLTVGPMPLVVTWTNPAPTTYGASLTSNQLNATVNVAGTIFYTPTNGAVLNVGTNTLAITFTPADTSAYSSVTNTVSLVVAPAPLIVTAASMSRAYGQANPVFLGTVTGVTNGDNITATYDCSATPTSPAGTYAITPTLVDPQNRETNYAVSLVNGTLTVGQAVAVITWTNPAPITYGALLTSNQLNATASVPGAFAYTPTNGDVLDAGTNTLSVTFTPADTVDYGIATSTVSLVVSPAPLIATAASASRAYGEPNPVFMGTLTGVTNGDNITATYSCGATNGSPAGFYPIVPSLIDPNNRQTNYTVSLVDGTLTVGQVPEMVTWTNPAPINYGAPLTSNQLNATANVPGSFAYTPTNGEVLDTGTNSMSVTFTPNDTVDYSSATITVSLVVSPAPLTVTAANESRAYGQSNPVFVGTLDGVTNGDNITATYICSATNASPVGPYPIVPGLVDPNNRETNYTVTLVDGTLTVSPAVAPINWTNPAPIIYGAALTSNQLNAAANVPGSFAYAPTNGAVLDTGTNTLTVLFTPTDTVDYGSVAGTVSLVVSPAPLAVTAANASRIYDQANPPFTGIVTGLTNGDDITATYNCSATNSSPVGMYSIVPGLVDPNNRETNYTVTLADGTLTVGQSVAAIIWINPAPIIYGPPLTSNQLNATADVPGSFAYTPTNGAVVNAGTNTLSVLFTPTDTLDFSSATDAVSLVVSPALLTVASGVAANGKVYDGTTTATLSFNDVAFAGVMNGDAVSLNTNGYLASFASAGVGHEIAVAVSGLTLNGAATGNYTLTQPENLIADITAPSVQIVASSSNIVISWATNASVFSLQHTASLTPPVMWSLVTNGITVNGKNNTVVINPSNGIQFFELIAAP